MSGKVSLACASFIYVLFEGFPLHILIAKNVTNCIHQNSYSMGKYNEIILRANAVVAAADTSDMLVMMLLMILLMILLMTV